ncbi:MAG: CDP-alcohol phosphatidyltransferase family protein [Spirochaetaceae bacterium]|jgi:CDP-diacylglycerol--glycerol-3-phosphate 3-phosphatidyltransferase|nr:CDP-alcohol phosphatidyltransferase family protein [Spirochaetaceae bacterium]
MRLADKFTMVRIIFAPLFFIFYMIAAYLDRYALPILAALAAALVLAELTDWLDGSTARKLNQVSDTGKILDPFADAFLHITIFFCFTVTRDVPAPIFILIFYREFGMLFLRLQATRKGRDIAARMGGKFKTVLYITTCFWILAVKIYRYTSFILPQDYVLYTIKVVLFTICVIAAYLSFFEYLYQWVSKAPKK